MMNTQTKYFDYPSLNISDLKACSKRNENWEYLIRAQINNEDMTEIINFKTVHLQGYINQKPCDDVSILKDFSGKVKLTNCCMAAVDIKKILTGSYCVVDGILIRETGLPEVSALKINQVTNKNILHDYLFNNWRYEVQDFKLYALGILQSKLD